MSTAEKCVKMLREGADKIEKDPYSLDEVMTDIEEFWGHQTGRLGKEPEDEEYENY